MARTQTADYGPRREAIVDRAAALFASAGPRGTSVAELAAACKTSKSMRSRRCSSPSTHGLADTPASARVRTMLLFGMINWTQTWFDASGAMPADAVGGMALDLIIPPRL